jgi:hypothetical protein
MNAIRLSGMAVLSMALLGLAQAAVSADTLKKNVAAVPQAVAAAVPVAGKEGRAVAKPGVSAVDKFKGAPVPADLVLGGYYAGGALPEGFPGVEFCDPNPAGGVPNKLRYRIANHGGTNAGAFMIRFDFGASGQVMVPANGLNAGEEKSGAVNIPAGCFPPGYSTMCQFSVMIDSSSQVGETNEANNSDQSFCVGPAT